VLDTPQPEGREMSTMWCLPCGSTHPACLSVQQRLKHEESSAAFGWLIDSLEQVTTQNSQDFSLVFNHWTLSSLPSPHTPAFALIFFYIIFFSAFPSVKLSNPPAHLLAYAVNFPVPLG
jgi:hypothetical protein